MATSSRAVRKTGPSFDANDALSRAERARRAGNLDEAVHHYGAVLRRFPANRRARTGLSNLGSDALAQLIDSARAAQAEGRLNDAEQHWAGAVMLQPDHLGLGLSLMECRIGLGRIHGALDAVDSVLEHHRGNPTALDARGRILRDLGRFDEAESCHRAALGNGPADAAPLNHLGILAQARGDRAAARAFYGQALALHPDDTNLHFNLTRACNGAVDQAHLDQMLTLLDRLAPNDPAQAALRFALFDALDARDDRDAAFHHLVIANRLRNADIGYDLGKDAVRMAFVKALFASEPPLLGDVPDAPLRPVFIVGLPRSGTTLVEQILAQASGVQAAGELSVVANCVAPLLRRLQSENRMTLTSADLRGLRADLLDALTAWSNGSPVLIDKMPLNFRWLGFICAALPEARIVHLTRDPMAVAWSLYRHSFTLRGNGFAYDLGSIAGFVMLERDLMQHWRARLANRIHDLNYADLVADPETVSRALVDACGLDWSEACLTPHDSKHGVLTASAAQVRRPIYGGSNAAWHRYETQLAPLATALASD